MPCRTSLSLMATFLFLYSFNGPQGDSRILLVYFVFTVTYVGDRINTTYCNQKGNHWKAWRCLRGVRVASGPCCVRSRNTGRRAPVTFDLAPPDPLLSGVPLHNYRGNRGCTSRRIMLSLLPLNSLDLLLCAIHACSCSLSLFTTRPSPRGVHPHPVNLVESRASLSSQKAAPPLIHKNLDDLFS